MGPPLFPKSRFQRRSHSPPLVNILVFDTSVGWPTGLRPHPQLASDDEADAVSEVPLLPKECHSCATWRTAGRQALPSAIRLTTLFAAPNCRR